MWPNQPRDQPLAPVTDAATLRLPQDAEAAGLEVDDSYLFNLDGEDMGLVGDRRPVSASEWAVGRARQQNGGTGCFRAETGGGGAPDGLVMPPCEAVLRLVCIPGCMFPGDT